MSTYGSLGATQSKCGWDTWVEKPQN